MKKTLGVFSLIVMLLSQVFSPFVYAVSGEEVPVDEVVVEEPVIPAEDTANEVDVPAGETETVEALQQEPETPAEHVVVVNSGDQNGTDLNTQNGSGNIEYAHDSAVVETGTISDVMSGDIIELSGGKENLEGTGEESKPGIMETIKNFLGLGESKEEGKKEVSFEYESQVITGEAEYEGVKVGVYADTGLFYSGTELVIQAVTGDMYEGVKEVLSGQLEDITEEEQTVVAFDISFIYSGEEVQPLTGTVQVSFNYENNEDLKAAEEDEEQEVKVYHLNDKDDDGEKIEEITGAKVEEVMLNEEKSGEENVLVVEAESFSVYTIVKQVKEEQLINFQYGMISIANPSNPSQVITIMDRNLGATTNDITDKKSYGYHYQWGNNYGFDSTKNEKEISTSNIGVNVSSISEYNSSTFITKSPSWTTTSKNLWGEGGQGPCPEGWHVPTSLEWENLYTYYNDRYGSGINGFITYFKISFGGYRQSSAYYYPRNNEGCYWSSTPARTDLYANSTIIDNGSIETDYWMHGKSDGLSVRCFKNSPIDTSLLHKISIDYKGGIGGIGSVDVLSVKNGEKIQELSTPTRRNSNFLGWYLSGTNTEFNITGTPITEDISLYAKWSCKEGFFETEDGKNCIYEVTFDFNANGGFFYGDESNTLQELQYYCGEFDCYTNVDLQNPDRKSQNMSQQSGWMFAGWYMKSGINNDWGDEFNPKTVTTSTVYAKWLPFNDLSIKDGKKILFTIMDRNLGASAVSEGVYQNFNLDEFGFYYQWGNNYGFSNNPNIVLNKSENQSDASSNNPNNYYLNNIFVTKKSSWDLSNNGNLRGGLGDTDILRGEGIDENRQGPCPVGYHVPSEIEWRMAYKGWYNSESKSIDMDSIGKNFAKDFKMPFAGYRYYYDSEVNGQGSYTTYRTSSPSNNNSDYSYALDFYSNNVSYGRTVAKANGYPVRCFKNTIETSKKLLYLTETGEKISEYDFIWWEPISSNYRPENPRREGYEFVGWYESGSDEEYDFSQDRTKNLTLYEKWVLIVGGENPDIAKLAVGSKVNAIIKTLSAGEPVSYNKQDVLIEGFERSPVLPEGGNKRLISAEDSDAQIFAWFDSEDKKIKYYTNAKDVYLNEDSSYTFYYLKNLKSFNVNDFKTDYVSNMEKMFSYSFTSVEGLTLDFTKMNLSNVKNMKEMFAYDFSKIWQSNELPTITGVTIDFSNTDLSNVETMYQMFFANYQTVNSVSGIKIDFSNANMNDVTTMYQMFGNNYQQISNGVSSVLIDFTDAKMNSVKNMKYMLEDMFENVSNHTNGITISLENVKLPNVEDMSYMFTRDFSSNSNRSGIYINLKNMVVSHDVNIEDIFENIFNNGGSVEGVKIDLSNSDFRGRKDMSGIFESTFCSNGNVSGVVLDFSNSLYGTNSLYHFLGYAFQSSSNVSGVQIFFNNADFGGVTSMNNMFQGVFTYGRGNVEGITIDFDNVNLSKVTTIQEAFDYAFSSQVNVKGVSISFNGVNFESLGSMKYMFRNTFKPSSVLSGISLDFNNLTLGSTDMTEMFGGALYDVDSIKGFLIDFSNTNMSNVERMSNIFQSFGTYGTDAEGIIIDFSNADISNIEDMSHMFDGIFSNKNNLKEVIISFKNTDLSNVRTMSDMFDSFAYEINVLSGVTIDFSEADLSKVENMHYMFQGFANNYNGNSINSVAIKWNKAKFTSSLTKMSYMFNSCQVEELDLSNFDTSNVTTMENMFYNAKNLKTIYVGSRFRTNNVTNSNSMFSTNTKLEGGRGTKYSDSNPRDKTYARIDRVGEPGYFTKKGDEIVATLLPGQEFNAKIKTIAKGNSATYSDSDIYIKRIKEGTKDQMIMEYLENGTLEKVSTTYSEKPVYAWYSDNNKTLYYYSEADVIDMNIDASYMFSDLTKLEEVDIREINTSSTTILSGMFMNDGGLTGLDFENINLSSAKNIQNIFKGCSNLEKINFSNTDMQSITSFNGVFTGLPKLGEISFSKANLRNLTGTNNMFGGSSSLEYVDFNEADMRKVTDMTSMFGGNSKLKRVNFRNTDLRNVTNMGGMFGGSSLQYADFENADMRNVENMASMFGGNSYLTGVNFSGTNLSKVTTMNSMFGGDSRLEKIDFSNHDLSNLETMGGMFGGCSNLTTVSFKNSNMGKLSSANSMFGGEGNLLYVDMSNTNMGNVEDMTSMFGGCGKLQKVNFSGSNLSSVTTMESMFGGDSQLLSVDFTNVTSNSLENMQSMFGGCSSITRVDLSSLDLSNVKNMITTFGSDTKLQSVNFGNNDLNNVENMNGLFNGCKSLEELDITKWATNKVTNMAIMFLNATNLKTIYIGDNFSTENVTESTDMFSGAIALIGGNGTTYDESKIDKEYAVADVEGIPGYLTHILDKKYTITYNLHGGVMTGAKLTYTQRTSYTLPEPTREGYKFKGWTGSNGSTPEKNVTTEGKKGNLEYTANWEVIVPEPSGNTGGGGSSTTIKVIDNKTKEQEHKAAEEKQVEKQKSKQEEQIKEEIKASENTNTSNQTTTQQSSSTSSDNSYKTVVDPEIQSAYEWAYERDVTTIPSLDDAMPDGVVKRGHLAKMVVNYATNVLGREIPEKIPSECRWNDWRKDWESEEIKDYAVKSCALGLMGLDMPKFLPNMEVTRAQFGTIMSRLLWGKKYAGGTPYYRKHLNALKENNIMTQIENPERRVELRQWVWLMLMRSAENK